MKFLYWEGGSRFLRLASLSKMPHLQVVPKNDFCYIIHLLYLLTFMSGVLKTNFIPIGFWIRVGLAPFFFFRNPGFIRGQPHAH